MITFKELGKYGRVGNQLFQVASTIGIAIKNDDVAVFPKWFCNYTKKDMTRFLKNPISECDNINFDCIPTYQEPHFYYSDVTYKNNLNLHGYYQTEKYFLHCTDLIRFYFEPNQQTVAYLTEKYPDTNSFCSVHVRRGDYVKNAVHDVCDEAYFNRATDMLRSKDVRKFMVFSDDIEWCKSKFIGDEFTFVEGNNDIEDLFLMSMCGNNIISNSSFSWWGSWLNGNTNKIVVAPARWFGTDHIDQRDVYANFMIKI